MVFASQLRSVASFLLLTHCLLMQRCDTFPHTGWKGSNWMVGRLAQLLPQCYITADYLSEFGCCSILFHACHLHLPTSPVDFHASMHTSHTVHKCYRRSSFHSVCDDKWTSTVKTFFPDDCFPGFHIYKLTRINKWRSYRTFTFYWPNVKHRKVAFY